ncbi:MAG: adenylate/guanylate cyclase domain-containing protein [Rhodothermales bacterium]
MALLNEVAAALGAARDLGTILRRIVREGMGAVGAGQGTVTLVDAARSDDNRTVVRTSVRSSEGEAFRPSAVLLGWMHWYKKPIRVDDPATDDRFSPQDWAPAVRTVLSVPLLVRAGLIGVLTVFNKRGDEGFSAEDERLLAILAAQSAQVIENARVREEGERVRRVFGQHTDPAVVDALMGGEADVVPQRQSVCVMFLDVRDFTAFAEQAEPEAVVDYLNGLLWFMIEAVTRHHGIVHQLLGDGFMAIFGAPVSRGNDCRNAVHAALEIVERLRSAVESGAVAPTRVGIGLHAGEVVAGLVGSKVHREYKVTGDVVNLAARIEGLNKDFDSAVLASEAVWRAAGDEALEAEALGAVEVRGRQEPVVLYRLA